MLETHNLPEIKMPVSDLDKLETRISYYGVEAEVVIDRLMDLGRQLPCELDFLVIIGMFAF